MNSELGFAGKPIDKVKTLPAGFNCFINPLRRQLTQAGTDFIKGDKVGH